MKYVFWTGGYSNQQEESVCKVAYDPAAGFSLLEKYQGFLNPSFVLADLEKAMLYIVEETAPFGAVQVLRYKDGKLCPAGTFPTDGADPCHLSLSEDGKSLSIANYTSGSLAVFRLNEQGEIIEESDFRQHTGRGTNPDRQEGPHVHFSMEKDGTLYVCDLGLDRIFTYQRGEEGLTNCGSIDMPAGSGPRHLAFNDYVSTIYCAAELNSRVYVIQKDEKSKYQIIQEMSTLPKTFQGGNTTAAIRLSADGRILMVSNRGNDSIAIFSVDENGLLSGPVFSPCVGNPRDFVILGNDVIVGSQRDSEIRAYRLEADSLRLVDTGYSLPICRPTCFAVWEG